MPVLSIIIPAYNEAATITDVIERVIAAPVPEEVTKEIVIVNDASKDNTAQLVEEYIAKHPILPIKLFHQPVNKGKGAAL
ncbi:MAG TPA: glycosyltransferase, partial [Bacteroidales bacterium]|nr:glycosyltransferase [Bacteroidales bacterium]